MDIAILLYDRFTALDALGPYEVLARIPDARVTFVGVETGEIRSDTGALGVSADRALSELPSPDVLLIPGGPGHVVGRAGEAALDWIRGARETATWTTSVCTGALILAAAGVLDGRRATTHWTAREELRALGVEPVTERVVFDGDVVTAAGVSAGIDMALTLAARIAGDQVAQTIQLAIEYDPQPPFDAGSPEKAPTEIVEFLRQLTGRARAA